MPKAELQDILVRLDVESVRKIEQMAEERSTSLGALLREQIESLAPACESYQRAKHSALENLGRGLDLGGPPYATRDELYER